MKWIDSLSLSFNFQKYFYSLKLLKFNFKLEKNQKQNQLYEINIQTEHINQKLKIKNITFIIRETFQQFIPEHKLSKLMQEYHHADQVIRPNANFGVWIGDLSSAQQLSWLKQKNIKTVITAAEGVTLKYDKTINHIHYRLQDTKTQNISKVLEEAADKIDKSTTQLIVDLRFGGVLVHCGAGVSRSSTLVIGYLIKYHNMSFIEALRHTKSKRPVICPNLGFQLQLKSFQKYLKSKQLINAIKQKNFQLPEIQKGGINEVKQPIYRKQSAKKLANSKLELKSHNKVGGGFMVKIKLKRQNSLMVGNSKRHLQSNGFHDDHVYRGINTDHNAHVRDSKDVQYLKKMAMFRFGITNTEKWKLG